MEHLLRVQRTPNDARGKKGLLKEQLELIQLQAVDGRMRHTIRPLPDALTFDKGFYVFVRALQMLRSSNEGTVLVGLAGPSGSGKTAFSEKVKAFMPGVAVIAMDMYNDGSKVIDDNFDDPRLTDYDTLMQNLTDLRDGKPAQVPIYDFRTSTRTAYREQPVPDSRVIIIEGIYALNERLRPLLDLRVSITGGVHFDLVKRVMRDVSRSGQAPDEIIQQITDTVYPMYKAFIEPSIQTAQLRITNSFNPFSGFLSPTLILKSRKVPELPAILEALQVHGAVSQHSEVDIYDIYLVPPSHDRETCSSWLRLRNRDGRYSLMFEEWMAEGDFIISPRISFEVGVRILGGLMALGYEIGTIMRRTSQVLSVAGPEELQVKLDEVEGLGCFIQVFGKDRARVASLGTTFGLDDSYIPRPYIEQVQLEQLTANFQTTAQNVAEDWRKRMRARSGQSLSQAAMDSMTRGPSTRGSTGIPWGGGEESQGEYLPCIDSPASVAHPLRRGSGYGSESEGPNVHSTLDEPLASNGLNGGGRSGRVTHSPALLNGLQQQAADSPVAAPASAEGDDVRQGSLPASSSASASSSPLGFVHRQSLTAQQPQMQRGPAAHVYGSLQAKGEGSAVQGLDEADNVQTKLDVLASSMACIEGMQVQMDAMTMQMRLANEKLGQLASQSQAAASGGPAWLGMHTLYGTSSLTAPIAFLVGVAAGAVTMLLLRRAPRF